MTAYTRRVEVIPESFGPAEFAAYFLFSPEFRSIRAQGRLLRKVFETYFLCETLFPTFSHVFRVRGQAELGSYFSEYLRYIGGRYVEPFFSPKKSFEFFYGVATIVLKNKKDFHLPPIYRITIQQYVGCLRLLC